MTGIELKPIIETILTNSGLAGAVALLFLIVWWRSEKRGDKIVKEKDDRIATLEKEKDGIFELRLRESNAFREEIGKLKDAEIVRQGKQMEMYHEFEKTVTDLVRLVEQETRRKGR